MNDLTAQTTSSRAVQEAEGRLLTLLPGIYRDRVEEVQPVSMGSAPLAFDVEGNVAWDRMWGSFCDLAMAGGPPHKGKLLEAPPVPTVETSPDRYVEVCDEIIRGIALAARLRAEPSDMPGWLRVICGNPTMAEWMLRAITMENVSVRLDGKSVLLPAGPGFRVEKEIKNVITVTAKTAHYWSGHLIRLQQIGVANLFDELNAEAPLLQPGWDTETQDPAFRERIETNIRRSVFLPITSHTYTNWIGLDCGAVPPAITTMRRLVASNVLCRREDSSILVPLNAISDPDGARLVSAVVSLLAREKL